MSARLRRHADRVLLTSFRAVVEFVDDRGHRAAAQIAFFALLSAIPLALLLVGFFGLAFDDEEVRRRVIDTVFDAVPLATDDDRRVLERTTTESLDGAGELGAFSIVLLLAAASGVMGALRHAVNVAWDIDESPPLLRRKALDLSLVLGATVVLALSLALSATDGAAELLDDEGDARGVLALGLDAINELLPYACVVAILLFLYRVLPKDRPKVREIWPGAVVAAIGLALTKVALDVYFEHFADFGALYGSLGALMALLLFVFVAANVLVFGAEFASEWSRLPPDPIVKRMVRHGLRRVRKRLRRRR